MISLLDGIRRVFSAQGRRIAVPAGCWRGQRDLLSDWRKLWVYLIGWILIVTLGLMKRCGITCRSRNTSRLGRHEVLLVQGQ